MPSPLKTVLDPALRPLNRHEAAAWRRDVKARRARVLEAAEILSAAAKVLQAAAEEDDPDDTFAQEHPDSVRYLLANASAISDYEYARKALCDEWQQRRSAKRAVLEAKLRRSSRRAAK